MHIELAELLLYKIGWLKKEDVSSFFETAMAKLFISECYLQDSLNALRLHGAFGYMEESGIEEGVRDAAASIIYSGTSEYSEKHYCRLVWAESLLSKGAYYEKFYETQIGNMGIPSVM